MLDEVGEPALVVRFLERAGVDPEPQRGLARRRRIVADRVAHAVGQGAEAHVRIGGDVALRLRPGLGGDRRLRVALEGERKPGGEREQGRRSFIFCSFMESRASR